MPKVKHVLLISHYFPPLNRVPSLRIGQWAKYWGRSGVKVTVLTTVKHAIDGPLDLNMDFPSNVTVVEIVSLPSWMKRKKNESKDVKISNEVNYNSLSHRTKNYLVNALKLIARRTRKTTGTVFDLHNLWVKNAVHVGNELVLHNDIDIIVSSYGPPASHRIAAAIKKKNKNIPWVADYRDQWTDNHVNKSKGVFRYIENKTESHTVSEYADLVTTVSEPLAQQLSEKLGKRVEIIENGFDSEEFDVYKKSNAGKKINRGELVYTGTIYPGMQDATPLFEVIREINLEDNDLPRITVSFYGNNVDQLMSSVDKCKVKKWVNFKGYVTRKEAIIALLSAEALLFLGWGGKENRGVTTAKIFEYLASERPILGIGNTTMNAGGLLIEKTRSGRACGDNHACIRKFLLKLFSVDGSGCFLQDRVEILRYSRAQQANRLLSIYGRLLDSNSGYDIN